MDSETEYLMALLKVEEAQQLAEVSWSKIQDADPVNIINARSVPGRIAKRIAKAVTELNAARLLLQERTKK
jgi:hypothetical protein